MPRRDGRTPYRGPGRASLAVPTVLVIALLVTALVADHQGWGPKYLGWDTDPGEQAPTGLVLAPPQTPHEVAQPLAAGALDPAAVQAAMGGLGDPALGKHVVATVADLVGGEPVASVGGGRVVPASTTKLLTAAAALSVLGGDARFETKVVAGAEPGQVILVGGGDPYLASAPAGESVYPERADVMTLATLTADALELEDQTRAESGHSDDNKSPKVRLRYDTALFTGPGDNPRWRPDYVLDQIVSPIGPLWVDSGRDASGWGRVVDPARTAADTFAEALRKAGVRVVGKPRPALADPAARNLASVESAPLDQIVAQMLDVSDNETAEVLAHHLGLATSGVGSFEAGAAGTIQALSALGIDASGDRLYDGSGLSRENLISPRTLLEVLRVAAAPEHPELRQVLVGLPVAGFTGSLTWRFEDGPAEGRGRVRAKTGTLTGVHALAGLVADVDGNLMAFVLAADRVPEAKSLDARETLDDVAASLAACSCGAGASGADG